MKYLADGLNMIAVFTLGAMRCYGEKSEAFQAVAHLYVGGLFGFAVAAWYFGKPWQFHLALAAVLSLVELACFLMFGKTP